MRSVLQYVKHGQAAIQQINCPIFELEIRCDNLLEENKEVPPLRLYLSHGSIANLISRLTQSCGALAPSPCLRCADGRDRCSTCVVCSSIYRSTICEGSVSVATTVAEETFALSVLNLPPVLKPLRKLRVPSLTSETSPRNALVPAIILRNHAESHQPGDNGISQTKKRKRHSFEEQAQPVEQSRL
ncbi:hypothetical protein ED733_000637 [Metarhizium rileyi]|uniref:Uncharacterized protein n=1 Tax=Metarhizium rileyi (strain RCEF 4871) TaxID=1649241 RepID=A0A5C6FYS4_METRR|nr:hypothetical protein ED733_000637 [Metarhizium rileyi]